MIYLRPSISEEKVETIFHYCPTSAFYEIIRSRKIRFSDALQLNDSHEFHHGYKLLCTALDSLPENIPQTFRDFIKKQVDYLNLNFVGFAACFSLAGDSLSQWRAYADDGRGVCIGFSAEHIENFPARVCTIEYDSRKQLSTIISALTKMHDIFLTSNDVDALLSDCLALFGDLLFLKNSSFIEEREVRALHLGFSAIDKSTNKSRLFDSDGHNKKFERLKRGQISYRASGSKIIPYTDIILPPETKKSIKRIILGPKNESLKNRIEYFMCENGFSEFEIDKSRSTYR